MEIAKARKQRGKGVSGLIRRDLNNTNIASIHTKSEMKTQCQDYFHYLFFLVLILAKMCLENRITLTLNIVLYFRYATADIFLRDF